MGGRSASISTSVLVVLVTVVLFMFAEAALGTGLSSIVVDFRQAEVVGSPKMLRQRRANDYLVRMSPGKCLLPPGRFSLRHQCSLMVAR